MQRDWATLSSGFANTDTFKILFCIWYLGKVALSLKTGRDGGWFGWHGYCKICKSSAFNVFREYISAMWMGMRTTVDKELGFLLQAETFIKLRYVFLQMQKCFCCSARSDHCFIYLFAFCFSFSFTNCYFLTKKKNTWGLIFFYCWPL